MYQLTFGTAYQTVTQLVDSMPKIGDVFSFDKDDYGEPIGGPYKVLSLSGPVREWQLSNDGKGSTRPVHRVWVKLGPCDGKNW